MLIAYLWNYAHIGEFDATRTQECEEVLPPLRLAAASELLIVINDSPQPHCPVELGLMNMNSDLFVKKKFLEKQWKIPPESKSANMV